MLAGGNHGPTRDYSGSWLLAGGRQDNRSPTMGDATPDGIANPQIESDFAVTRVRAGLWALIAASLVLAASELVLQADPLPLSEASRAMVLVVAATGLALLWYRPTRLGAFSVAQVAIAAAAVTTARAGVETMRVPTAIYIALDVLAVANTPWGALGQLLATVTTGACYLWNMFGLAPGTATITSRDFIGFVVVSGATVYFAHLFESHRRLQATARAWALQRAEERDRQLRELEARVEARTATLTTTNAKLEQEIQERRTMQEMLELLMDSVPPYVAYVGADLRYRWVNRQFTEWWKRPLEAFVGRHLSEVHHGKAWAVVQEHLAEVLGGRSPTFDVVVPIPAGETRRFEITVVPHLQADGVVGGFFVFGYDMTERFVKEETAHRTERLAALGTLAAGIAHEINNPAASILTTADLGLGALADGDLSTVQEALRGIAGEALRCGEIVRSVLHFAREEPSARKLQPISDVIARATDLLRPQVALSGGVLHLDVAPTLPPLLMNASEIIQVIVNLVTNAFRAQATEVTIAAGSGNDMVRLRVTDNGCGMTENDRRRAFDPFFTTGRHSGGTGLGLTVTHAIIMAHTGQVEVQSTPGVGTTITIALPVGAARGAPAQL